VTTPAEAAGAADAVHVANQELYSAVETADLDRMAAVWVDEPYAASAVCVHPGWPAIQGRSEVLRSWAAIMANTSYIQFFLTDIEVEIAGEVAIVTCAENILTGVGGGAAESALAGGHVVATNVFRRTPSGWRLWVHHASPVIAPREGAAD
jgi:ketosteroid isomerase-like protein